mmetsp:Transcript_25603/g.42578  ORF Transcript_25603/g.42578 Transcript_25603/m.42578 type:complete len:177 (+) Transcript_25603:140-670(+)
MLHPFHIHVNPFMILNSSSQFSDNQDLIKIISDYTAPWDTVKGSALSGIWRDTAYVPPYGYLVIKQCYDAGVKPSVDADAVETFGGKFVFHCHFLVHEDTGLMRNVIIESKNISVPENTLLGTGVAPETAAPSGSSAPSDTAAPTSVPTGVPPTSGSFNGAIWLPLVASVFASMFS